MARNFRAFAAKSNDLLLAFFIVAVIALMILPMPSWLIDTLVASNMALGVMLVLMSIYVSSALQFSSFPSILLISTLFRLALSIATTRMILLTGDAGNIIDTFGTMVAGGNIVVGLVVFLIITLVQFLVIAKGAERVAEVGARFTLDAMPGKQLSIDSDLRSGLIDKVEARRKRADLEKESQLHGSLDGAMKFVKGDAIAGIVVIIINLLGGLAVGVFQIGMSAGEAMAKYSILTIGDGLVAQIPALFGAMAAGLIVTRVSDSDSEENLGDAIQQQFASIPRVLLIAGVMCLLFALVPGFPTGIFIVIGLLLLFTGAMLVPSLRISMDLFSRPAFDAVMQRKEHTHRSHVDNTARLETQAPAPLRLRLPARVSMKGRDLALRSSLQDLLQRHHDDAGVKLPPLKFEWDADEAERWSLDIQDVPVCGGLIGDPIDLDAVAKECIVGLRCNIKLFLGLEETKKLLVQVADTHPELVKELERVLPLQSITVILRGLISEEVPLRNLSVALEGLVEAAPTEKDLFNLTEYARIALGRQIGNKYADERVIRAVGLSPAMEEMLMNSLRASGSTQELGASPVLLGAIGEALCAAIDRCGARVVVSPVVLRRHIRALIIDRRFDTASLSYPEINAPFRLDVMERVHIDMSDTAVT